MIDGVELAVAEHQRLAGLDDGNAARRQHIGHPGKEAQGRRRVGGDVHGDDNVEPAVRPDVREEAGEHLVPCGGGDVVEVACGVDAHRIEAPGREAGEVAAVVGRDLQHARAPLHAAGERGGEPGEVGGQRAAGAAGIEVVAEQAVGMDEMRELRVRAAGTDGEPQRERRAGLPGIAEQRVGRRLDAEVQERAGLGAANDAAQMLPELPGHDAFRSSGDASDASSRAASSAQRSAREAARGGPHSACMRAQFMRNE